MIWLFRVDNVFWDNKPKVNEHYLFDSNDTEFDITQYDISLYFSTSDYYLLEESNDTEIYSLLFVGLNHNPKRLSVSDGSEIHNIIRYFYMEKSK